jgi:hypothetical protein
MPMHLTRAIVAGAAAAVLAPAAAHGATLRTDDDCYVQAATRHGVVSQPIGIAGDGWAAGSSWSVSGGGLFASGTADASGAFTSTDQNAPVIPTGSAKPRTVTLTGQQDGTDVASVTIKVVNFLVKPRSLNGKPTGSTTWAFSGFQPGRKIYFHVKRGGRVWTQKAGRGKKPCGTLVRRMRRLPAVPGRQIRYGNYKVFVDNRRRFRKGGLQYTATITIFKRYV